MNKSLIALTLIGLAIAGGCDRQRTDAGSVPGAGARTRSSFDRPSPGERQFQAHAINFADAELSQVLTLYAEVSGRSVIRGGNLPDVRITFSNQSPLSAVEVLQALDTVLAAQGIVMIYLGSQYVKGVPVKDAPMEAGPVIELPRDQLPDSCSFMIYIVRLKHASHSQVVPALAPLAKLPNGIIAIGSGSSSRPSPKGSTPPLPAIIGAKDQSVLILRDYSSNIRRMLQVLEKLEEP